MAILPAHPNLEQLRHQAKDLLHAAQSGDAAAAAQLAAVSERPTLSAAQLVVARSYGFSSWPRLKAEVDARAASLEQKAAAFVVASVRDWTGLAARMLAETPELAGHSLATALVLGDVARVREEIERDPAVVTRADPATGWTALHAVCASRWQNLDKDRADGLLATARLLLDAGADATVRIAPGGRSAGSSPLRCAAAAASAGVHNEPIMRLLLERGVTVEEDDLYLAAFNNDGHRCLRLLLAHATAVADTEMALSAPVSTADTEGVRLLLEAGADPRRYAEERGQPSSAVYAAVQASCPAELIRLLIEHGADPDLPGPDGLLPSWLAAVRGRDDLAVLLGDGEAAAAATPDTARLAGACLRADRAAATALITADPGLTGRMRQTELASLVLAAEAGNEPAVTLMLDLGFPVDARRDDDGATALHAAAYAGSAPVVSLLIRRGADLEALDGRFDSPPLDWAVVGSGQRPDTCPHPDWLTTVRVLIEAGASTESVSLAPDADKPPSAEVASLLRAHGVGGG